MILAIRNLFGTVTYGCGILFLANAAFSSIAEVRESRIYRDFFGLTPFYDVVVYQTEVRGDRLTAMGEMKKRACEFADLTGFAGRGKDLQTRVVISTQQEDARGVTGNRTPSKNAQTWGPWVLFWPVDDPIPTGWAIYAGHWCPIVDKNGTEIINQTTGEVMQRYEVNLFASGDWADVDYPVKQ